MDDPIRPRALVPAEHKPRMRPLRPWHALAPGGQLWMCHLPVAWRWGVGHTQREAWEEAHGVPVYLRDQAQARVTIQPLAQLRSDLAAAYRSEHPRGSWWSPPMPAPHRGRS